MPDVSNPTAIITPPTPPSPPSLAQIRLSLYQGCVKTPSTGEAVTIKDIIGAIVSSGFTNGFGLFTSPSLPYGSYSVIVSNVFGTGNITKSVTLSSIGTLDVEIDRSTIPSPFYVGVHVTGGCQTDGSLSGATVSITGPNGFSATGTTGIDGNFRTGDLEYIPDNLGTYTAVVSKANFTPSTVIKTWSVACGSGDGIQNVALTYNEVGWRSSDDCEGLATPSTLQLTIVHTGTSPFWPAGAAGTHTVTETATGSGVYVAYIPGTGTSGLFRVTISSGCVSDPPTGGALVAVENGIGWTTGCVCPTVAAACVNAFSASGAGSQFSATVTL